MTIDIWNAPIVHLDDKEGTITTTSLAEMWPAENGTPRNPYVPKTMEQIYAEIEADRLAERAAKAEQNIASIYGEVRTPQTPKCQHKWEQGYSMNGPTRHCTCCGKFERD